MTHKRCLVIEGATVEQMRLDGLALWIKCHGRAGRRFPLRLINRIHCIDLPPEGWSALVHCAEQRIPVTLFSRRGAVRAQLYQPRGRDSTLRDWLDAALHEPDLIEVYQRWLQHQRLRVCASLGVREGDWCRRVERLRELCARRASEAGCRSKFRSACEWLQGFLVAHLDLLMDRRDVPATGAGRERLYGDLREILGLRLELASLEWVIDGGDKEVTPAAMASLYQSIENWVELNAERLLVQLQVAIDNAVMLGDFR